MLLIYLAASWVVLQVASLFVQSYGVPRWIMWAALLLLLAGLVVLVATAWVQTHPLTTAREQAEEVPSDWELELKGLGRSIARGQMPHLTWARAALGGLIAFALLFGFAGLWVVIQDRGRSFSPDEALAEAGPGIAVLPFQTTGAGLDVWREGVIDLLSTNLDGAGGLRAIDSRTVLARWGETVTEGAVADLATSLEAARKTGARYAVIGTAVGLGSLVRLSADVYEVESGRSLGQTQVEGAPDSVYMLVDRLAIDVLRTVLGSRAANLPRVELARATTASLPALRAYLEGELLYRRAEIPEAMEAYRRAVEADTTFALAYKRLAETIGWLPFEARPEPGVLYYSDQAMRYVDRLPEREAILVRGHRAFLAGSTALLETLKQASLRYPDDPEILYLVQEFYAHLGDQLLLGDDEKNRAFDRLMAMDPTFAPFYQHPIEHAFQDADSARTTALLSRYERLVDTDTRELRAHRMAYDIAWGGPEARSRAIAAADTTDPTRIPALELLHPRFLEDGETLARAARSGRPWLYARAAYYRGRAREALSDVGAPNMTPDASAYIAYHMRERGAAVDNVFARAVPGIVADSVGAALFWTAAVAAEEGRWDDYQRVIALGNAATDRLQAAGGDTLFVGTVRGTVRALEAYATWRRGDREAAYQELTAAQREATGWGPSDFMNRTIRWWIVRLALELGRPEETERYLLSLDEEPYAHLELGRLYERMGRTEEARERYELFVTAWRDADPDLQPKVAEARQALARLGFRPRG
jgi:serine/threonine-protein kinase